MERATFLPFDAMQHDILDLSGHQVLKTSRNSYSKLTPEETKQLESAFASRGIVRSWPIVFIFSIAYSNPNMATDSFKAGSSFGYRLKSSQARS